MSTQSDETRERWSKATPGPWSVHPDPEAIASAPEEVRVLLEEIDRLHARAERAEKLLGRFREEVVAAGCPSGDSDHQLHHLRRLLESVREDRQRIEPELRDMDVESARPHLRRRAKVLERGLKALSAWCGDDIPQMEPRHDAQALMELLAIVVEGLPGSRAAPAARSTPPLLLEKLGFDIAELLAIAARSHRFAGRPRRRRPGRHGSAHGRKQR